MENPVSPFWAGSITATLCCAAPCILLEANSSTEEPGPDAVYPGDFAAAVTTMALFFTTCSGWATYEALGALGAPGLMSLPAVLALGASHLLLLASQARRLAAPLSPEESGEGAGGVERSSPASQARKARSYARQAGVLMGAMVGCREIMRAPGIVSFVLGGLGVSALLLDCVLRVYLPQVASYDEP